ncbi:hypothetical protein [Streptomyces sp. NPDC020965]|uniref:hypothetical protein n=1 Tax=Streptomyces sp. NPDC020965 TaxID=3365105 RepID=UPI0037A23ED4
MEHVIVEWREDDEFPGYHLDPNPYLAVLPDLSESLPPGAREFAQDPAHYAFGDPRCVKNLKVVDVRFSDDPRPSATLRLSPNPWMHTECLTIEYRGISKFSIEVDPDGEDEEYPQGLDRILLDEILPAGNGCGHEIRFSGGSLTVSCEDLQARWEA